MRSVLILSLLLAGSAFAHEAAHEQARDGHEREPAQATPVQQTEAGAVYGAEWPEAKPAPIAIDVAAADPAAHLGKPAAYSGEITQVCQKKGCWLVLSGDDGRFARVAMHDHAFSVPTDARGPAVVYGTLAEKEFSAAEIEHLKKDGAKAPAARELSIDALSVLIPGAG